MAVVVLTPDEARRRLDDSIYGLERRTPELSAFHLLSKGQKRGLALGALAVVMGLIVALVPTLIVVAAVITAFYLATIAHRVLLFFRSLSGASVIQVSDEEAMALSEEFLPVYTVLVPAYREPQVIRNLIAAIGRIQYPRSRLDVKLLLEEDDRETIEVAEGLAGPSGIEIVLVPAAEPRTKPKALNFGLSLARGDLVTVYDAEDHPDPLQLRRAVAAFHRVEDHVVCLQAKLSYHNVDQNIITRWFTLEYAMWYSLFLPGLVATGAPLPLGGTSNHFRRQMLLESGGWDPFNVTEDADLGIRMHRKGLQVRVLDSTTYEEANSDFVNWVKQRSRWYKGYLQTWIVHMRRPRSLWRDLGPWGFLQFQVFVGGTPTLAVINPLLWITTAVWFIGQPHIIRAAFPAPIYYAGLLCFSLGNFAVIYLTAVTTKLTGRPNLIFAALLSPVYWVMMAVAATKAFIQLALTPSHWEKTMHGLDRLEGTR